MTTTTTAPQTMPLPLPTDGRRRVAIDAFEPLVDGGSFPARRVLGDRLQVRVVAVADGHDLLAGVARWQAPGTTQWQETPLTDEGNDRYTADIELDALGTWQLGAACWIDTWGSWRRDLGKRVDAGQDVSVELEVGARLVDAAAARAAGADAASLATHAATLRAGGDVGIATALGDPLAHLMSAWPDRAHETAHEGSASVAVDPVRARYGSWYERFPRSCGAAGEHGTLADLEAELPRIAKMGFTVLYLPPVHPIGREHRKGRNNAVAAAAGDVGSPWAIGSSEGGHLDVHPQLGTVADVQRLVAAARSHGMDVALDLAWQCAPDHPWVTEHPSWFAHRPDGSIRHAENPPKLYQDIYPIDFDSDDWAELWQGLRDVVATWIARGITTFRVDNPHTKSFRFWEWMIADIRREHPDTVFLAEAFTRPAVMYRLAKIGFSQSYTYFTWRRTAAELREYLTELTSQPACEFFRPNFWPNTPDILTDQLQHGTRGTFVSRLVLAATLSASYGIYGPAYELMEREPVREGSEEYLDSEKYELRHRDLDDPRSLAPVIERVNAARAAHPALQRNDTLRFHDTGNEHLLAYTKTSASGNDVVLVVVNCHDSEPHAGEVTLPVAELGLDPDAPYTAHDLLGGATYTWHGPTNYVELDPAILPAHILHLRRHDD